MIATREEIAELMASDLNLAAELKGQKVEDVPCPICGVEKGHCVQMAAMRRVPRNDFHAARKYACVVVKRKTRQQVDQVVKESEDASGTLQVEGSLPEEHGVSSHARDSVHGE